MGFGDRSDERPPESGRRGRDSAGGGYRGGQQPGQGRFDRSRAEGDRSGRDREGGRPFSGGGRATGGRPDRAQADRGRAGTGGNWSRDESGDRPRYSRNSDIDGGWAAQRSRGEAYRGRGPREQGDDERGSRGSWGGGDARGSAGRGSGSFERRGSGGPRGGERGSRSDSSFRRPDGAASRERGSWGDRGSQGFRGRGEGSFERRGSAGPRGGERGSRSDSSFRRPDGAAPRERGSWGRDDRGSQGFRGRSEGSFERRDSAGPRDDRRGGSFRDDRGSQSRSGSRPAERGTPRDSRSGDRAFGAGLADSFGLDTPARPRRDSSGSPQSHRAEERPRYERRTDDRPARENNFRDRPPREDRSRAEGSREDRFRGQGSREDRFREDRFRDADRPQRERPSGSRIRPEDVDHTWPEIPEWVDVHVLGPEARADLRGLSKQGAEFVGGHLAAAAELAEAEPEQAWEHARAARAQGGRIAVVRETVGLVAYRAGKWAEALTELRAARRMAGGPGLLAVMADAERALGNPDKAIELSKSPEAAQLDPEAAAELQIVVAGARSDLGQHEAALASLRAAVLAADPQAPYVYALYYAYAAKLAEQGELREALTWYIRAADADADEETDAAEQAQALADATNGQ